MAILFFTKEFSVKSEKERVRIYRKYVYEDRAIMQSNKPYAKVASEKVVEKEQKRNFEIRRTERFRQRMRYFMDSGVIGTRKFVANIYRQFKHLFQLLHEKKHKAVKGLFGNYIAAWFFAPQTNTDKGF